MKVKKIMLITIVLITILLFNNFVFAAKTNSNSTKNEYTSQKRYD